MSSPILSISHTFKEIIVHEMLIFYQGIGILHCGILENKAERCFGLLSRAAKPSDMSSALKRSPSPVLTSPIAVYQ